MNEGKLYELTVKEYKYYRKYCLTRNKIKKWTYYRINLYYKKQWEKEFMKDIGGYNG